MIKIIALLPMKGNSERVPNKNLKLFNGTPLFHKVLTALLNSKYIENVIVNTDSDAITQNIKEVFGEKVVIHNRPEGIQGDMVSMNKIIEYDLLNSESEIYLQTHSTNPLLESSTIDSAIEKMFEIKGGNLYDSLFSVTKIQTRLYDTENKPLNHNPNELLRTQDLPPLFEENSNFYLFTKDSFFNNESKRIGKKPYLFEVDKLEAIDIDEPQDFVIAQTLYKLLR
jgi:N-acylneuraminate cytidylyltransferase